NGVIRGPSFGFSRISNASAGGAFCPDAGATQVKSRGKMQHKNNLRSRFTIFYRDFAHCIPTVGLPTLICESYRGNAGSRIEHGDSHIVVAFSETFGNVD